MRMKKATATTPRMFTSLAVWASSWGGHVSDNASRAVSATTTSREAAGRMRSGSDAPPLVERRAGGDAPARRKRARRTRWPASPAARRRRGSPPTPPRTWRRSRARRGARARRPQPVPGCISTPPFRLERPYPGRVGAVARNCVRSTPRVNPQRRACFAKVRDAFRPVFGSATPRPSRAADISQKI